MQFIRVGFSIIVIATLGNNSFTLANELESFTSVSQLKEIQVTDWEYQTLQSLTQSYDCATEFDKSNNSFLTRYDFALALNNCLEQIETLKSPKDLIRLQKLQQEFAQELAFFNTKIDNLETRFNQLKSQQFSSTTKLEGQVLFFAADSFGGEEDNSQLFSGYRIRLDFNTSFSGRDALKVRLESREVGRLDDVTDTFLSRLSVDGNSDDRVEASEIAYGFPLGESTEIFLGTAGVGLNDVGEVLNPFSSSSRGAVSRFGRRDPATLRGPGGAGVGIKYKFNEQISASAGYLIDSGDAASPQGEKGLFNSSASAIAQLVIKPEKDLALALIYTHTYQPKDEVRLMGATGLEDANEPFADNATTSDNFGLQFNWEINSGLEIGGWFGYTQAKQQEDGDDSATILNGALTFAFPNLGAENNIGGIIIGVPPVITNHDDSSLITQEFPMHIEALYRIELSKNIEITPGVFAIINPESNNGHTLWVGTVRTLFSF